MGTYKNSDGLMVRFGRDVGKRGNKAAVVRTSGRINELVLEVDLEGAARTLYTADRNNDGTLDGFVEGLDATIPAGAKILSVDTIVVEAEAGTTPDYTVGTFQEDGTALDADGLRAAAGAAGAQVGTELAQKSFVTAVATGTHTAGIIQIVVRFMPEA